MRVTEGSAARHVCFTLTWLVFCGLAIATWGGVGYGVLAAYAATPVVRTWVPDGEHWSHAKAMHWFVGFPAATVVVLIGWCLAVVAWKWLLVGPMRPRTDGVRTSHFLRWNWFHMHMWALTNALFGQLLHGTWMYLWWLRALGAEVGAGAVILTDRLGEFDLLKLGSGAVVDTQAVVISHTLEGGQLRLGPVTTVGRGASVGVGTVVLPGATLEARAVLGGNSLAMPGASFAANTRWVASPVHPDSSVPLLDAQAALSNKVRRRFRASYTSPHASAGPDATAGRPTPRKPLLADYSYRRYDA